MYSASLGRGPEYHERNSTLEAHYYTEDTKMTSKEDTNTTPVYLDRIEVIGTEGYKKKYVEKVLSPLLSSSTKTIGELASESDEVLRSLSFLGGFQSVGINFDIDNKSGNSKVDILDQPLTTVFGAITAKPLKPTVFSIKSIHNDLGNAFALSYLNRNVFGNGEQFQLNTYWGLLDETKSIDVLSSTPIIDPSFRLFGHLNVLKASNELYQSKQQAATSAEIGVLKQKVCNCSGALSTFSAGLNLVNRNIGHIADSANDEVKTYAGDSLKESVFFNFVSSNMSYLTKSSLTLPLNGFTASLTNEVAGFPALLERLQDDYQEDAFSTERQDQFYKLGLGLDFAKSVLNNQLTFLSNFKLGSIINFASSTGGTVHFQDKFYPLVTGYKKPMMPSKSVGSGSFLSYNLGFSSKVGLVNVNQPLRFYSSINGASVSNELAGFKASALQELSKNWKHGLDVGLLYSNGDASAKLFWHKPIDFSKNDVGKFGFEVDITGTW